MADDFVSDDDKALFRDHMRSVKPLNEKSIRAKSTNPVQTEHPEKSTRINNPAVTHKPKPVVTKKEYFLSDFISEHVLSETVLSYCDPAVSSKQFRDLKNGQTHWEARLDLHGFRSEAARNALCQFIQTQTDNNKRCLLIIHGKGGHQGAPPIIKNLINRWLPQFDEVLAFHSALPKDGGHGAVYVLLKRLKLT